MEVKSKCDFVYICRKKQPKRVKKVLSPEITGNGTSKFLLPVSIQKF